MAYHETTIRARIKTVMDAITDIGTVHARVRFIADWAQLRTLYTTPIDGVTQFRGWEISLTDTREEQVTFHGNAETETERVTYVYRIRGWLSFNDADNSEAILNALALEVCNSIKTDATLASYSRDQEFPLVMGCSFNEQMFAGVLCNHVEILAQFQEDV